MEYPLKKISMVVGLLFIVLTFPVSAELKVGFVNVVRLMEESPQVKNANSRLEREFAPKQRRLQTRADEIRRLEERVQKDAAIMSESESARRAREIRDKVRDLRKEQEEFRDDYNFRRNKELNALQKELISAIKKLAEREKYDIILSDGVVWASKRIDITEKILRQLKGRY